MTPLIKQNVNGIVMCGRKGRFKFGSRKRRIRSPKTVRKKKENSTIPIKVTRAWKLPITIKIMLITEGAIKLPLSNKGN